MSHYRIYVDFILPPEALDLLVAGTQGHELLFPKALNATVLGKAPTDSILDSADIAFGQPDPEAVKKLTRLRWMHVSSSGITRYDTAAFRQFVRDRKILFTNSAQVYFEPCAQHTLSFILAQARHIPEALRTRTANGTPEWRHLRYTSQPLQGQEVLILGFGAIGARLAELMAPLHMKVRAFRRRARGDERVPVVSLKELPAALGQADHVINILPDSTETRHFFNEARLSQMKPGSVFYNIGRGSTVDQESLVRALKDRLAAAWLDVTDPEPLPDAHPLWQLPNCYITPHIAGGHVGENLTLVKHFLNNLRRYVQGEPMLDVVENVVGPVRGSTEPVQSPTSTPANFSVSSPSRLHSLSSPCSRPREGIDRT